MSPEHGPELARDVNMCIGAELAGNPADESIGSRHVFRQNQMAQLSSNHFSYSSILLAFLTT